MGLSSVDRLDDLYAEICHSLDADVIGKTYPGWSGQAFEQDMQAIEKDPDPVTTWRKSVSAAHNSHKKKIPMHWVGLLWNNTSRFFWTLPRLPAEDRLRLEQHWSTVFAFVEA